MRLYSVLWLLTWLALFETDAARILGVFPLHVRSHYILGDKLMRELASKGHDVTYISPFERKKEHARNNLRDILISHTNETTNEYKQILLLLPTQNTISQFTQILTMVSKLTDETLNHTNVQRLFKSDEKFDLVILDAVLNEAHMAFGYRFKAPTVVLSPVGVAIWVNDYTISPTNPSYQADVLTEFPPAMGFLDRLKNTVISSIMYGLQRAVHFPTQNAILHKYFPDAPHVEQLMHNNISMVLLNSHPSYGVAKPSTPNMIEIGGYHVDEPKELPKDLKQYLDMAKRGVILFSMGSNLKSTMLAPELRATLMSVFAKLPCDVLWKFEDDHLEGKPDNVKIHKWLPQNDILAHPNIRLFITHGGLLSTTEAVYHGVPIVGIPVFGDQMSNMANAERMGIGKTVHFQQLDADQLYKTVLEVLNNKAYRENIRHRSSLLRDQPLRPIDNAVFWIEYSLRNGYSDHFKTSAILLQWYEIMLVDVIATLILGTVLVIALPYFLIKKLCCRKQSFPPELKKKKKN